MPDLGQSGVRSPERLMTVKQLRTWLKEHEKAARFFEKRGNGPSARQQRDAADLIRAELTRRGES